MIGKGATPSFFAIANDNYTLTNILAMIISEMRVLKAFEVL